MRRVHEVADSAMTLGLLVVFALALPAGCVTSEEHRAFVEGSRAFFEAVAPVFSAATSRDDGLAPQSKKNRLAELEAYEKSLVAAEARVKR